MLPGNIAMTFLGMRDCKRVGDKGGVPIARALAGNQSMKKLIFEFTSVGDGTVLVLSKDFCSLFGI
jgi:hypothetical protein